MEKESNSQAKLLPEFCNILTTGCEDGHVFKVPLFDSTTLTYYYYSKKEPIKINVTYSSLRIYIKVNLPIWSSEIPGKSCLYISNTPIHDEYGYDNLCSVVDIPIDQTLEYTIVHNTAHLKLDFTKGVFIGLLNCGRDIP